MCIFVREFRGLIFFPLLFPEAQYSFLKLNTLSLGFHDSAVQGLMGQTVDCHLWTVKQLAPDLLAPVERLVQPASKPIRI